MTDAQWLFEYHALKQRDDERVEMFQAAQKMLVSLLGLDHFATQEGQYIPLALLTGQPEILAKLVEEQEQEERAVDAADDPEFDAWSEKLAMGDLDDTDLWPGEDSEKPLIQFTRSPQVTFDED